MKQQQQQPSNIILIRGARTENGQIILQNGHELLSLLNSGAVSISSTASDDDKTIFSTSTTQSSSILLHRKAAYNSVASKQTSNELNKFVLQSALKSTNIATGNQIIDANSVSGNGIKSSSTLLHSSQALKNLTTSNATSSVTANTIPEGSIILQQRLNKNGTHDGPILLQTLKRIDKSPSILLFRNNPNAGTGTSTCTLTTATQNIVKKTAVGQQITVVASKDDDRIDAKHKNKTNQLNVPLGAGKYKISLSLLIVKTALVDISR